MSIGGYELSFLYLAYKQNWIEQIARLKNYNLNEESN